MNTSLPNQTVRVAALATGVSLALSSLTANAFEYTVSVGYIGEQSDNIRRVEFNEESDTIHRPTVTVGMNHDGDTIDVVADYVTERRMFADETFDDETITRGFAVVNWEPITDRFRLRLRDLRQETAINTGDVDVPDNRQTITRTSVGPLLTLPVGTGDAVQAEYTWAAFDSNTFDNDGIRHSAALRYVANVDPTRSWQFELNGEQAQFENPFAPDIETVNATVRYNSGDGEEGDRNLSIGVGYDQTSRTQGRDDVDGVVFDVTAAYRISASQRIRVVAERSFDDNGQNDVANDPNVNLFDAELALNTDTNELFIRDTANVQYTQAFGRNTLTADYRYDNQAFEDIERDQQSNTIGLTLERQLRPNLSANVFAQVNDRTFDDFAVDFTEQRYGARVFWNPRPSLSLNADVQHIDRESDDNQREYSEVRFTVGIEYVIFTNAR